MIDNKYFFDKSPLEDFMDIIAKEIVKRKNNINDSPQIERMIPLGRGISLSKITRSSAGLKQSPVKTEGEPDENHEFFEIDKEFKEEREKIRVRVRASSAHKSSASRKVIPSATRAKRVISTSNKGNGNNAFQILEVNILYPHFAREFT